MDPGNPVASPAGTTRPDCPNCGGRLGPPVTEAVHCFVQCTQCRTRFELDDPDLVAP